MEPSSIDPTAPHLSEHANVRSRQRGFRSSDVDLVLQHGTAGEDGTVLTSKDVNRRLVDLKREMAALERLAGTAVVTDGSAIITMYHANERRQRHMLRRSGRRCRRD